jgi:hypothetical protein
VCWNFEELGSLCQQQGLPDSTIYQNAMHWKLQRAEYHAKVAREAWSRLDRVKGTVVVGGAEWNEAEFASTAETEAAAQVMHSFLDVGCTRADCE